MLTKFNRRTVATDSGEIIPHATVSFYWQFSGLPATVYADPEGGTPLGASVQSDPQGRLGVFMVPGYYRIVVTLGGEILDELTYEPIVNELAVSGSTDVAVHMAEMEVPSVTSYLRTLPSGFSEWRTPAQVKSDLSLDQVNNTSDAQKPISIAVAAALAGKISSTEKGAANGVATLTAAGLIPPAQLPSYVDDVIERTDFASLPTTGETGKIYITTGNNKQYRWSGTAYVELVSSPGSTDAVPEGSTNKYFTEARVRATVLTGYTVGSNTSLASTDTILAALGKVQGQLNGKATTAQGAKADTALQPGANLSALTNDLALINQEAGDGRYARRSQNLADLDSATTARVNLGLGTAATATVTTHNLDTTPGRALRVGDFSIGKTQPNTSSGDLNNDVIPSIYLCGGTEANLPLAAPGTLRVECYTSTIITQFFTRNPDSSPGNPAPTWRRQFRTAWSPWRVDWNEVNLVKTSTTASTTSGEMVKVGDYGNGLALSFVSAGNLNDYKTLGSKFIATSTVANFVPGWGAAVIEVIGGSTNTTTPPHSANLRIVQRATQYDSTLGCAYRGFSESTGTWSAWVEILTSGTALNYAPATVEQNTRNASYTLALTDNNKHLYHSNSSAYTWTIPPNSSVAFPIGATVTFVNDGSGNITIAQGSGVVIVLAGTGTTGNRTLAQYGMVTALKVGTDRWFLNGAGVS